MIALIEVDPFLWAMAGVPFCWVFVTTLLTI